MKVTLVFDVEDPITPESDDVALWLAEILREEGMRATFFVTGDKVRALRDRGRTDVIDALRWHDVAFHSDTHSVHPTISEYLETAGWEAGVEAVREREYPGIELLEDVFETSPSAFGRTGGSYGPQFGPAMAAADLAYVYSPIDHPTSSVYRFADALTFGMHTRGFDARLTDDDRFAARLTALEARLATDIAAGREWLAVFGAHPTILCTTDFWDVVNFERGNNPPREQWRPPELRPTAEVERAKANFRRLVRYLVSHPGLEPTTIDDLCAADPGPPSTMERADLVHAAAVVRARDEVPVDLPYSPAETLVAFATAIDRGAIPTDLARHDVLGPMTDVPPATPVGELDTDGLCDAATAVLETVATDGAIPASVECVGGPVGIATLYDAFAAGMADLAADRELGSVELTAGYPYPAVARDLEVSLPAMMHGWPIHDPSLDPSTITAHTMRQTWTLAPVSVE